MARKPGARPQPVPAPIIDGTEPPPARVDSLDQLDRRPVDEEIAEWAALYQDEGRALKLYLYRQDEKDRRKSYFLRRYSDCIPDLEEIARDFGPGAFKLVATVSALETGGERRASSWMVYIDPAAVNFAGGGGSAAPGGAVAVYNGNGNGAAGYTALMAEMVKMFTPLMAAGRNGNNGGGADMAANIANQAEQYRMINNILADQARENAKMILSMNKRLIEAQTAERDDYQEPAEPEPRENPLEKWMPLINQFLPLLLGRGPQAGIAAETIKALPEYQAMINDRESMRAAVMALTAEIGEKKAGAVLARLGLKQ